MCSEHAGIIAQICVYTNITTCGAPKCPNSKWPLLPLLPLSLATRIFDSTTDPLGLSRSHSTLQCKVNSVILQRMLVFK